MTWSYSTSSELNTSCVASIRELWRKQLPASIPIGAATRNATPLRMDVRQRLATLTFHLSPFTSPIAPPRVRTIRDPLCEPPLDYWREAHRNFFGRQRFKHRNFAEGMPLVCKRFRLVYVLN
jgi:hypothetical protein